MRFLALFAILSASLAAGASNPAAALWNQLQAKRQKLSTFHEEFEVSRTFKLARGDQSSKWQSFVDESAERWRESTRSGSGERIRIFDGQDFFLLEAGEQEYVRLKRPSKNEDPVPSAYELSNPDWSKALEVERRPCGLEGSDHTCVILEVPLKGGVERLSAGSNITRVLQGVERMMLDTENGLLISCRTVLSIDNGRMAYQADTVYVLKRLTYGGTADASLFQRPSGDMREVKELSKWNVARLKKELAGQPAPELAVRDLEGKPVTLSAFRGKTVLLDFWTTWCPPCRADGPSLDKLYRKYSDKNLQIIGISVSEDRPIVEKFLKEHPHGYPIVLTTENDMPRPYEVGIFPTYIVIAPDGTLTSAAEGDQGFAELRKMLKKAGMDTD
ncbi:MAG TPA: TlpA disulfide reductase family protein [Bryobacteraceae bacterium]|nr:TlpA disulfide reductase family protein [Bryobacteraceae bacterium]